MQNRNTCKQAGLALLTLLAVLEMTGPVSAIGQTPSKATEPGANQNKGNDPPAQRPAPGGAPPVIGAVVAVRGNVLQMRTMGSKGLTRVICASDAQITREETLKADVLMPGMKVEGTGRQIEGTGTGTVPMKVEVQSLQIGGGSNPFQFFGGQTAALLRGRRAEIFRKQNYSGTISFDATVKSIHPLVLTDERGAPLPVVIGSDVEVHQRKPRALKEGDINAGAFLLAMGETSSDGLLNAHSLIVLGEGRGQESVSGTITGITDKGITMQPRFEPQGIEIEVSPTVKLYYQEHLDLDSIQVGDRLVFNGRVIGGSAKLPTTLAVRAITSPDEESPKIEQGGMFGGGALTATVTGKITAFDPLRIQTEDGREITLRVPGQVAYVRHRPIERSALKAGQKALLSVRTTESGRVADVIVLNPSPGAGPNF
jgi:hypothetical protein